MENSNEVKLHEEIEKMEYEPLDPVEMKLIKGGVVDASDMIAFHPYAGKSAAWDLPYGLVEGALMSKGRNIEIFCNESGFPANNQEWFTNPPELNEQTQNSLAKANQYLKEYEREAERKIRIKTRQRNMWIIISAVAVGAAISRR